MSSKLLSAVLLNPYQSEVSFEILGFNNFLDVIMLELNLYSLLQKFLDLLCLLVHLEHILNRAWLVLKINLIVKDLPL